MKWSYSRIKSFESCPYKFFLSYIEPMEDKPMFFSDYGLFMHKIIEKYLNEELKRDDLAKYYLTNFRSNVKGVAPKKEIFKSYFVQGLQYLENMEFPYDDLLGVEKKVNFCIGDKSFTGFIDCVAKDNGSIIILDNKSRALKPRSQRSKPTKSDNELDEYLKQLYIYSIPIHEEFHIYPERLEFNCFRTGELISEPFREEALEETKRWANECIEKIIDNDDWSPRMEYWKCRHLCSLNHHCIYYQMNKG